MIRGLVASKACRVAVLPLSLFCLSTPAWAQSGRADSVLAGIEIEQRLGSPLPTSLHFVDEAGRDVELAGYFGDKPVIVAPVYYECPMLCTLVLNGLVKALKPLGFEPGRDFEVVVFSFDPGETPELAAAKKQTYLEAYGRAETAEGWHFLTGNETSIRSLTEALGFEYRYDDARDEYAHAASVMIATPDGRLARYFFGVEFAPRDLRLGLVEASQNEIGSLVDRVLLYCYHYDPSIGAYSAVAMNMVRLGGVITLALAAGFIGVSTIRERRARLRGARARC
jgi:protein SCO1/2